MDYEPIRGELIAKKEITCNDGTLESLYRYRYLASANSPQYGESFDLVMETEDFCVVCLIDATLNSENEWVWERISIEQSVSEVHGDFVLRVGSKDVANGKFESSATPFELDLLGKVKCSGENSSVAITFNVYYTDDDCFPEDSFADYERFYDNGQFSDVTFIVGNNSDPEKFQEFPAHRVVLSAHSNVFYEMFQEKYQNNNIAEIKLDKVSPAIFKMALCYIYCGKLTAFHMQDLFKLLKMAMDYKVKSLIRCCCFRMERLLDVHNVVDALFSADELGVHHLRQKCMNFIIQNKDLVVGTEGYQKLLDARRVDLLSEIFSLVKVK